MILMSYVNIRIKSDSFWREDLMKSFMSFAISQSLSKMKQQLPRASSPVLLQILSLL